MVLRSSVHFQGLQGIHSSGWHDPRHDIALLFAEQRITGALSLNHQDRVH